MGCKNHVIEARLKDRLFAIRRILRYPLLSLCFAIVGRIEVEGLLRIGETSGLTTAKFFNREAALRESSKVLDRLKKAMETLRNETVDYHSCGRVAEGKVRRVDS